MPTPFWKRVFNSVSYFCVFWPADISYSNFIFFYF